MLTKTAGMNSPLTCKGNRYPHFWMGTLHEMDHTTSWAGFLNAGACGISSCLRVHTHAGSFVHGRCLSEHWQTVLQIIFSFFLFQGRIACANVLSDLYAMGVTECDNMLMLLGISNKMTDRVRFLVLAFEGRPKQLSVLRMYLPLGYFPLKVWTLLKIWFYWMSQFIVWVLSRKHCKVTC